MATKYYVITTDKVDSTLSTTSENPVQNKVIKSVLDSKLDIQQAVGDAGKVPMAGTDGKLVMSALPDGKQADWNQTTTTQMDFIKNKPFHSVGSGLTVREIGGVQTLVNDYQLHFQVFTTLPTASEEYKNIIGLIAKTTTETGNAYEEYACIESPSGSWTWELLGAIKGTVDQTASAITVNGIVIQTATDAMIGLMSAADHADMQRISNKVTSIAAAAAATDTKYPTEKAVRSELDLKETGSNKVSAWQGTVDDTHYPSEKLVKDTLDTKVAIDSSNAKVFNFGVDANGLYVNIDE